MIMKLYIIYKWITFFIFILIEFVFFSFILIIYYDFMNSVKSNLNLAKLKQFF